MINTVIKHYPVMLENVINRVKNIKTTKTLRIADCNFGFGGHSVNIIKHFPNTQMYIFP